ncbi:natural cytotoxicity triggering receptor 2-like [Phyllostomus hastatus]|uniref:natural cytotoxicity triggering receptor 2-like n=1 Tax=Phyllostomus hastatus TaxID=9423 RepID=UPI001E68534D|nr:natural cytotoxicity triggering receptor 2-like [Phyllostomus hastatus]XP_045699758.1 natural cytotoxicity triggering receptor 2-like [Phyllostomus hastatus]
MAWEATQLLPLVLLVLLASGSSEQQPELLQKLEGETISVRCLYPAQKRLKTKVWCRRISESICTILVAHPSLRTVSWKPQYFIQDNPRSDNFVVTMTKLGMKDSGFYACGTYESSWIIFLRTIHLVVSQASTPSTTSSTTRTTAWTSATSPASNSPPGHWGVIFSATVALLLLLVLILLMILFLCKALGRARTGKDKSHHTYDTPVYENETVYRKGASPRQRESQLSWGSDQHMGSGEDPGDIHYASLSHLNYFSPEDSIYVNTHPRPKPTPDPFLAVEYSSIAKNRPQHSKSAALEEEPRI